MEESKVNTSNFQKDKSINLKSNRLGTFNSNNEINKTEEHDYSKNIYAIKLSIKKNKSKYKSKINNIQNEILKLKSQISAIEIPCCDYTQKDLEQNLIKQKLLSNTINLYKEEFDSTKENISLLLEDYNNCSLQLYNFISLKDNYEESIKDNSKHIFKNLMISLDQNTGQSISNNSIEEQSTLLFFHQKNNIKVEYYDINNIQNLAKFSNMIYKILSSHITSLITENNIKSLIFSSIEGIFYDFIENKINSEDFVKKVAFNISTCNDKFHNFILISRFEILLKYIIKTFSFEKRIDDLMQFINKDYSSNKLLLEKKQKEIKLKIQNLTKEKIEYIKTYSTMEKEYNNKIKALNKIENLKLEVMKRENDIIKEESKYKLLEKTQRKKINTLENLNKNFDIYLNESDIQKTIQNIQKNINNLSNQIKNKKDGKANESSNEFDSKELCNITDINNKELNKNFLNDEKNKKNCYILIKNTQDNIEFDPIKYYDIKPESKGFNKSLIYFEKDNINIIFNQIKNDLNIKINYNSIKHIFINPIMKKIIYYMKKYYNDKNKIDLILTKENDINTDDLIKYIYNKYFCLSLALENDKIINIIFLTYKDFKTWLKIFDKFYNHIL